MLKSIGEIIIKISEKRGNSKYLKENLFMVAELFIAQAI